MENNIPPGITDYDIDSQFGDEEIETTEDDDFSGASEGDR
jgi:hypothetical protein